MTSRALELLRAPAFVIAFVALVARTAAPASLRVEDVRVAGGGEHWISVSATDTGDRPVTATEGAFQVRVDGHEVEALVAAPAHTLVRAATVVIAMDGQLLRDPALQGIQDAVRELGRSLSPSDRIRIVVASDQVRTREAAASSAGGLARGLGELRTDQSPVLLDALFAATRDAAKLPDSRRSALILVAGGAYGESHHKPIEILAMARSAHWHTPLMVVLVGDAGVSTQADRLRLLALQTGGSLTSVITTDGLVAILPSFASRELNRWILRFRVPGWRRDLPSHHISVALEQAGTRSVTEHDYETAASLRPAWWSSRPLGLGLAASLLAALAMLLLTRRRQRGLLVHHEDQQDGVWYELFEFPVRLGASSSNDIVFDGDEVSRHHAILERRGRVVELVDQNSENGSFVNGERVPRRVLRDGDLIGLGPTVRLIYEARG